MTGIADSPPDRATGAPARQSVRSLLSATEIDMRLLGMLGALVVILVGFHILSGGKLINPANMVTLGVQATGTAIMATGMVLIIVSRNIDLSVGSQVGVTAMVYAVLMTDILPNVLGIPVGAPYMWIVALALGVALGAFIGAFQGFIIAYIGVPSFVVTLGGLLALRGTVWVLSEGASVTGIDNTFRQVGGGVPGSLGGEVTWLLAILGCVGIVGYVIYNRRQRVRFGFPLRPMWAEVLDRHPRLRGPARPGRVRQRERLPEGRRDPHRGVRAASRNRRAGCASRWASPGRSSCSSASASS